MKNPFALPPDEIPSSLTADGWEAWKMRMRTTYPIRYFVSETLRLQWWRWKRKLLHDPYWWVMHRFHPAHRYHILHTGLKPGYYDPSTQFLYAILTEVSHYVEVTNHTIDWEADETHRHVWATLSEAANWFIRYKIYCEGNGYSYDDEDRWEKEADQHLVAIMKIRQYVWYP